MVAQRGGSRSESTQDAVRLASAVLHESFQALHSCVKSDHAALSRVTSGWPQVFLDASELAGQRPEPFRRRFTASELRRAEARCEVFSRMEGVSQGDKRCALAHVMSAKPTWRGTAARVGRPWAEVRGAYDDVMLRFYYAVCQAEGSRP